MATQRGPTWVARRARRRVAAGGVAAGGVAPGGAEACEAAKGGARLQRARALRAPVAAPQTRRASAIGREAWASTEGAEDGMVCGWQLLTSMRMGLAQGARAAAGAGGRGGTRQDMTIGQQLR